MTDVNTLVNVSVNPLTFLILELIYNKFNDFTVGCKHQYMPCTLTKHKLIVINKSTVISQYINILMNIK
jgi:hypothetical protein